MLQVPPQLALQLPAQLAAHDAAQVAAQVAAQLAAHVAPQVAPQVAAQEPSQLFNSVRSGHSSNIERHLTVRVIAPPAAASNSVSVRFRIDVWVKPNLVFLVMVNPLI